MVRIHINYVNFHYNKIILFNQIKILYAFCSKLEILDRCHLECVFVTRIFFIKIGSDHTTGPLSTKDGNKTGVFRQTIHNIQ